MKLLYFIMFLCFSTHNFAQSSCNIECTELIENSELVYNIQPNLTNLHTTFTGGFVDPWIAFGTPHHIHFFNEWPFCSVNNYDPQSGW